MGRYLDRLRHILAMSITYPPQTVAIQCANFIEERSPSSSWQFRCAAAVPEDWWHDPPKPSEAKRLPKVVATGELRSRHGLAVGAGFSSLADDDSGLLADRRD